MSSNLPARGPATSPDWPTVKPRLPIHDALPGVGFETIITHYAENPREHFGAAAPPIYQTSTFYYPDAEAFEQRRTDASPHYDYSRVGNPTNAILEAKLARLEKGEWAEFFGSGMGAISSALNACVASGSHVVIVNQCYGPARMFLEHLKRFGVSTTYVAGVDPADFIRAIRPETRVIYLESPTSGLFELPDVAPICAAARERGIITIFDNSWASPFFMNPLEFGVDLVLHSASKYLNGHSDVIAGVVIGRDRELQRRIWREMELNGAMLDPMAGWLILRGLRTLSLRLERHQASGLAVARLLEAHPRVARVHHPGLESHPQHAIARRQLRGYSGLFSFELNEASREATHRFLNRLRHFGLGVSWGGHESLALGGTHFGGDGQRRWVIRLSVGLESGADLVADVQQALE